MFSMKYLIVLTLIICSLGSIAQVQKDDLKKINQAYLKTSFTSDVTYSVYKNGTDLTPLQTEKGYYKLNGKELKTCMQLGSIFLINTPDFSLTMNSENKNIYFTRTRTNKTDKQDSGSEIAKMVLEMVDTLLKYNKGVQYKEFSKGIGEITFYPSYGEHEKIRIRYNRSTFLITELEFFYKNMQDLTGDSGKKGKPRLKITYSNFIVNPAFTSDEFAYTRFISEKDGKYMLKSAYSGYKLTCN